MNNGEIIWAAVIFVCSMALVVFWLRAVDHLGNIWIGDMDNEK